MGRGAVSGATAAALRQRRDATLLATLRTARAFGEPLALRHCKSKITHFLCFTINGRRVRGRRLRQLVNTTACGRARVAGSVNAQCRYHCGFITNSLMHHRHQEEVCLRLQPAVRTFWMFIHV